MATKSTSDLKTEVARNLRIIMAGDSVPADEGAEITDKYDTVFAMLLDEEIAYWDKDAIPERVFDALGHVVAGALSNKYWAGSPEMERTLARGYANGIDTIRKSAEHLWNGESIMKEYF